MTTKIVPVGNISNVSATTAVTVSNIATRTNTFRVSNASTTVPVFIGAFDTYAEANAVTAGGQVSCVDPGSSMVFAGDFGMSANLTTVYVATITESSSATAYVSPIAP